MSDQELAEIEARAARATPGPWHLKRWQWGWRYPWDKAAYPVFSTEMRAADGFLLPRDHDSVPDMDGDPDSVFMAHAREDVPALLAEVRRLRSLLPPRLAEWHSPDVKELEYVTDVDGCD